MAAVIGTVGRLVADGTAPAREAGMAVAARLVAVGMAVALVVAGMVAVEVAMAAEVMAEVIGIDSALPTTDF